MKNNKMLLMVTLVFFSVVCLSSNLLADVKHEKITKMEFKGGLGTMMKLFGANKPVHTVDYYKGNLHRTDTMNKKGKLIRSQIIDLDRELLINIDHKKKKYTQMTFEQWREMMQQNLQEFEDSQKQRKQKQDEAASEVEWSFKLDISTPGETETIAGKKSEKAIIKLDVEAEAKDQPTEGDSQAKMQKGKLTVTSTHWLWKSGEGEQEIQQFNKKFAEKLGMQLGQGGLQQTINKIMQSNEQLAEAMKKMQAESEKLTGLPMRTHTVYETSGQEMQSAQNAEQEDKKIPTSVGGLLKGFGKKLAKSKQDKSDSNVLLESNSEIKNFETAPINANIFEIPAKYKMKK